jgi:hypothetical protein
MSPTDTGESHGFNRRIAPPISSVTVRVAPLFAPDTAVIVPSLYAVTGVGEKLVPMCACVEPASAAIVKQTV